jgi:predicted nucleic acid-binding protein
LNGVYFDTAYIAKCYLQEADALTVREFARSTEAISTSAIAIAEIACTFHRHVREGTLTTDAAHNVREQFLEDLRHDIWFLLPVTHRLLRKVEFATRSLPAGVFLRAGDAIHLVSALDAGFEEIWTNDRNLLAAASYFGLKGRQVNVPTDKIE